MRHQRPLFLLPLILLTVLLWAACAPAAPAVEPTAPSPPPEQAPATASRPQLIEFYTNW